MVLLLLVELYIISFFLVFLLRFHFSWYSSFHFFQCKLHFHFFQCKLQELFFYSRKIFCTLPLLNTINSRQIWHGICYEYFLFTYFVNLWLVKLQKVFEDYSNYLFSFKSLKIKFLLLKIEKCGFFYIVIS